ncbi:MAG: hypothetical protein IK068_07250 [Lachnospiraceae bacterium]|nr:hypothetical protein [Lachnospiraceae bacterium]
MKKNVISAIVFFMNNSKKLTFKIYDIVTFITRWGLAIFAGLLFLTAFFFEAYALNMDTQEVLIRRDNVLIQGLVILIFIAFMFLLRKCTKKHEDAFLKIQFYVTLAWIFGAGVFFIFFAKSVCGSDPMIVFKMAESVAAGDLSVIDSVNSYLSYYPHQIGLMTFYVPFIKVWNLLGISAPIYHAFKMLNIVAAVLIVYFQFTGLRLIVKAKSEFILNAYLFLAGLFLPFIMYTSYVYGEVLSIFFMTGASYFAIRLIKNLDETGIKKNTILYSIAIVIFSAFSVYMRKNSLIFIIALSAVLLFEYMRVKKVSVLVSVLLAVSLSLVLQPLTIKIYEAKSGNKLASGVTAMSYLAMGMQESDRGNGWYNSFNFTTYEESGLDSKVANEVSKAAIAERKAYFKANPKEARKFYFDKYLSMWADGTYFSRQATLSAYGRSDYAWDFYNGVKANYYIYYCNLFQSVMFFGVFAGLIYMIIKKEKRLYCFIPFITVFGIFLFHMFWEANSRYVFPAAVLMLPYAGVGIGKVTEGLNKLFSKKRGMDE